MSGVLPQNQDCVIGSERTREPQEGDMINDIYFTTVVKQEAQELRDRAAQDRLAREANPQIRVFARATYLREVPALRRAGADVVFAGEGEVALTMTEFLLRQLGASAEQIDRERDRIRAELFGSPLTIEILLPPPQPPAADGEAVPEQSQESGNGESPSAAVRGAD